jgi:predicted RNA binding protein YcfA (HicA-like mRNA interferase family)
MRYQEFKEMSHREAEKILKKNNFHKERAHGSHEVYKNDDTGETFALPHKHHTKDLSKGVEHDLKKVVAEDIDTLKQNPELGTT